MNTKMIGLCWLGLTLGGLEQARSAETTAEAVLRHHFWGTEALAQNAGATRAKEVWNLPETSPFLKETLGQLAQLPGRLWPGRFASAEEDVVRLVSPLLEDLVRAESFSEVSGPTNRAEIVLAVKLAPEQANRWGTNLWQLVEKGTGASPRPFQIIQYNGWEASLEQERVLQFIPTREWLLLAIGWRPLEAMSRTLRNLEREGRPMVSNKPGWFEIEANLTALSCWVPLFRGLPWPRVRLAAHGDGDHLRLNGQATFRDPIPWTFEPWHIPTNSIVEPVVSFSVGQGIAPLITALFGSEALERETVPNQYCAWGRPTQQRQLVVTVPVRDATNALHQLAEDLPALLTELTGKPPEDVLYRTNQTSLAWRVLAPPAFPFVTPWREAGQDYLMAALLPVLQATNPPPQELFGELGDRQNLLYYGWEWTEERVLFASQFYQLLYLKQSRQLMSPQSPAQKWLQKARPLLGNTVTEVTRTGPRELSLVRKSHLGVTGFELVTLLEWITSPGFPLTFELPKRIMAGEVSPSSPIQGE